MKSGRPQSQKKYSSTDCIYDVKARWKIKYEYSCFTDHVGLYSVVVRDGDLDSIREDLGGWMEFHTNKNRIVVCWRDRIVLSR